MSTNISICHDIHQHSCLSTCSSDPKMTPKAMLSHAIENDYDTICITDHVWDPLISGASNFYKSQDIDHIRQSLPLPSHDNVRFCFGCETEYLGGDKLGLAESSFDLFDFIVIPVNHFHMKDFTRPSNINTAKMVANLMLTRLEELQKLNLPWEKVGIPHFTTTLVYKEGNIADVFDHMSENRLLNIFEFFADNKTGIELNAYNFNPGWEEYFDILLRPYQLAKQAGCKFYFASDAHSVEGLPIKERLLPIANALGLTAKDLYAIP